jgi:cobalt/nickel transport system permease protein
MLKFRFLFPVKRMLVAGSIALISLIALPVPVHAMHIAEGILPPDWAAIWYVPAIAFMLIGLFLIKRKFRHGKSIMPLLGLSGAAIFLISCLPIPVPVAGTCSHPVGTPLASILVGPFISTVLGALALLIQALLLGHGGLTTWGANIVSMGVIGSFVGFGSFILFKKLHAPIFFAAFAAGLLGDWATYAATAFELSMALHGDASPWTMFATIAIAFAPTQIPLGILEGLFTGGVVKVIYERRPELLEAAAGTLRPLGISKETAI